MPPFKACTLPSVSWPPLMVVVPVKVLEPLSVHVPPVVLRLVLPAVGSLRTGVKIAPPELPAKVKVRSPVPAKRMGLVELKLPPPALLVRVAPAVPTVNGLAKVALPQVHDREPPSRVRLWVVISRPDWLSPASSVPPLTMMEPVKPVYEFMVTLLLPSLMKSPPPERIIDTSEVLAYLSREPLLI